MPQSKKIAGKIPGILKTYREFAKACAKTRKIIPVHLVIIILNGMLEASPPALVGILVDQLVNKRSGFLTNPLFIFVIIGVSCLYFCLRYFRQYLGAVISETASAAFQLDLYRHLQKLSADFYQRIHVGEITSRLTNDINKGIRPYYGNATDVLWGISLILSSAVYLAFSNGMLFLLFLTLAAFNAAVGNFFIPRAQKRFAALQEQYGNVNAKIVENVGAHSLIRAFAREKAIEEQTRTQILDLKEKQYQAESYLFRFLVFFWSFHLFFAPFSLLMFGAMFIGKGVTIGNLVAAFTYWGLVSTQMQSLISNITNMLTSFAAFGRILEFYAETPLVHDKPGASVLQIGEGSVRFDRVCFRYPARSDEFEITNLSFTLPGRKKTALVGHSGCGKSTIAQLILRMYDTASGTIHIDGTDIAAVSQHSLRSSIGIVMQDTILLNGTFRSNMAFIKKEASEQEIITALTRAELWDFVKETPNGLDTIVGEKGIRLSGGQRQRIAIARVFLLEPPIVILDEATSALDAITERAIMNTMKTLLADRTSLVIAHRIGTVIDADMVIVLDHGRVAGMGSHRELFASNEYYRNICREQRVEASPGCDHLTEEA